MVRMGNISPLTASNGEIRTNCRRGNETVVQSMNFILQSSETIRHTILLPLNNINFILLSVLLDNVSFGLLQRTAIDRTSNFANRIKLTPVHFLREQKPSKQYTERKSCISRGTWNLDHDVG
ncbi:hypothetical protein CKAN_01537100 [Cinnamomum micranthum f. kanehirae]|uniref:Uncharacterized protein n=1 Tax=Cinnamomum micranthum f. kanehirae TaxID=337451 RepID=A0A443P6S9_9MAGN|nr:hypothetical protein CKAN_01537100 [Cinnamomum micranthum f. kanehirae]